MEWSLRIKVQGAMAAVGTTVTYLLGGWDTLLEVLVVVTALDVLTGLLAAVAHRALDSRAMLAGGARKLYMFALVALAAQLDRVLPLGQAVQAEGPVLRTAAIWFFMAHEGLSILENAGEAGLPIPSSLASFLRQLRGRYSANKPGSESDSGNPEPEP